MVGRVSNRSGGKGYVNRYPKGLSCGRPAQHLLPVKIDHVDDTVIINVSKDLPFAQSRFCESSKVEHVTNLSNFRCSKFGEDYGIEMVDGALKGLLGRAVVVLNDSHSVIYNELVPEIGQEPNYDAALASLTQTA